MIKHEKLHENRYQEHPNWTILRDFKPSVLQVSNGENKNISEGLKSLKIVPFGLVMLREVKKSRSSENKNSRNLKNREREGREISLPKFSRIENVENKKNLC